MTTVLLNDAFDGELVAEFWQGEKKVTVYITPSGETECLLVGKDGEIGDEKNLYEALKWLRTKE